MRRWKKFAIVWIADIYAMVALMLIALFSMLFTVDLFHLLTSYAISLIYMGIFCGKLYSWDYIVT
jgi:hypothetical protein